MEIYVSITNSRVKHGSHLVKFIYNIKGASDRESKYCVNVFGTGVTFRNSKRVPVHLHQYRVNIVNFIHREITEINFAGQINVEINSLTVIFGILMFVFVIHIRNENVPPSACQVEINSL